MNTKLILAALTIVVLGGTWFVSRGSEREGSALEGSLASAPATMAMPDDLATERPEEPTAVGASRTEVSSEPEALAVNAVARPTTTPVFIVQGRVVDAEARPIDGLEVLLEGSAGETFVSSDGGRIRLETSLTSAVLDVADDEWVAVRKGVWREGASLDPFLVCAPSIRLAGRVVEETGVPIPDARVVVVLPAAMQSRLQDVPDASIQVDWKNWTEDDGSFQFAKAPLVPGAKLLVAKDGFLPELLEDSERSPDRMEIVLRKLTEGEGAAIAGRVLLPDGQPASEARVALGAGSVPVDEEGFFSMGLEKALDTDRILAAQPGYQAVMMDRPGDREDELFGWPPFLELVLGPEPLSIRGRVVDHLGEPCEGAYVWIEDPTPFGTLGTHPLHIEAWSAGGRIPRRAIDSIAQVPAEDGDETFGSATPIGEPNAMLFWVRTDPDGGFEIEGLLDREYTMRAIDSELRWSVTSQLVAAGTSGFEFRVPKPYVYEQLEARVVTRHGDPVAGVRVLQWTAALDKKTRVFGGNSHVTRFLMGPSTVSDEDGLLFFGDVPKERIEFYIASDEILPTYASIEDIEDPSNVEVVVAARAYLNVVVEPADAVDSIHVTDVEGQRQKILLMRADGYSNYDDYSLTDGRSGVITVTSDAAFLHLASEGQVVETLPLVLRPGEVERIDFRL